MDVLPQCLGVWLRGERSVVGKLANAWRMRRLRRVAPPLKLSARQRERSFDVQRHRARVSLRANVKSGGADVQGQSGGRPP